MEPLTNKPTNQELIFQYDIKVKEFLLTLGLEHSQHAALCDKLNNIRNEFLKSLTENRSELVEKCVHAILYASHKVQEGEQAVKEETEKGTEYFVVDDTELFIMESKLRTALTQVLNPEKK